MASEERAEPEDPEAQEATRGPEEPAGEAEAELSLIHI